MNPLQRNNVVIQGQGSRPMMFAHGFGCDQNMWRFVAPAFEDSHRVVLFDHVGCGHSDLAAFNEQRHGSLEGWARDVVDILEAADLRDVVFVGHSVSSMIGLLACNAAPGRIGRLVMLAPSPRYLNDPPAYEGGFERSDVDALLDMIESNMLGWANFLAPMAMGDGHPAELVDELKASFCAIDPYITRRFATATFLGDNRADLQHLKVLTLVVEMSHDAIAPPSVGRYLRRQLPQARFETIAGNGHCPHMTHPEQTIALLRAFAEPA
jgi:sigma-B regulation protein RsbQ